MESGGFFFDSSINQPSEAVKPGIARKCMYLNYDTILAAANKNADHSIMKFLLEVETDGHSIPATVWELDIRWDKNRIPYRFPFVSCYLTLLSYKPNRGPCEFFATTMIYQKSGKRTKYIRENMVNSILSDYMTTPQLQWSWTIKHGRYGLQLDKDEVLTINFSLKAAPQKFTSTDDWFKEQHHGRIMQNLTRQKEEYERILALNNGVRPPQEAASSPGSEGANTSRNPPEQVEVPVLNETPNHSGSERGGGHAQGSPAQVVASASIVVETPNNSGSQRAGHFEVNPGQVMGSMSGHKRQQVRECEGYFVGSCPQRAENVMQAGSVIL